MDKKTERQTDRWIDRPIYIISTYFVRSFEPEANETHRRWPGVKVIKRFTVVIYEYL